jgi:hypothetical protein
MSRAPKKAKSKFVPSDQLVEQHSFRQSESIPQTGLYKVEHAQHKLPKQVTLRKGEFFPPCAACHAEVTFRLLKAAPAETDDKVFKVVLYSLPVLDEEDEALAG